MIDYQITTRPALPTGPVNQWFASYRYEEMGISRESGIGRKRRSAPPPTGPGSHGDLYLYLYQAELDRTPDAGRRSPRGREQSPQAMTPTPARDDGQGRRLCSRDPVHHDVQVAGERERGAPSRSLSWLRGESNFSSVACLSLPIPIIRVIVRLYSSYSIRPRESSRLAGFGTASALHRGIRDERVE